ncbi:MAG: sporulation integral membrane protein YlbJ [Candidatus Improbicoccus devescovinae]|nr:MAG: sporulation integral membrane protein YlbJ [Candidatus Improbicoccus devescovinae]
MYIINKNYQNKINKYVIITKNLILFTTIILLSLCMIFASKISSSGVIRGLKFCSEILIPNLFPFMALSSFIIYSGIIFKLTNFFSKITNFLFNMPEIASSAIILGQLGGYPVGAKVTRDLLDENLITPSQARRLILFCVGAGPAFVINIVGSLLFKNQKIGILMLISQIFSSFLIGIFLGIQSRFLNKENFEIKNKKTTKIYDPNLSNSLVRACESTSIVTINMCALVIIFSVLISFLDYFHISQNYLISTGITALLEITQGIHSLITVGASPCVLSFALSWGGICVHMQVKSILGDLKFSYFKFVIFRVIHAILSFMLTYIVLNCFKISIPASNFFSIIPSQVPAEIQFSSNNIIGSTALIFTCIYFLISLIQI